MIDKEEILISLKNVSLGYGKNIILPNINFEVKNGEFWGLVGPNGAGKSTLVKGILGLVKPLSGGEMSFGKRNGSRIRFGYIPQRESLDILYPLTVGQIVMMGRYGILKPGRRPKTDDWKHVDESLAHMGITDLKNTLYMNLSGGQQQRTLIARAVAGNPDVLVCDEPVNEMDIKSQEAIMELLCHYHRDHNMTVILISHHLGHIADYVEKIALINRDFWQSGDVQSTITEENLSRLYNTKIKLNKFNGKIVFNTEQGFYD
jgi:zinc transport system ATP-binding protein